MILQDSELFKLGNYIEPFEKNNVQPASIDISLGDSYLIEVEQDDPIVVGKEVPEYKKVPVNNHAIQPGEFVLAATKEFIEVPENLVVMLGGKSSIARLGLAVHITAGWVDTGFRGNITLEIVNHSKNELILYEGLLIGQLVFMQMKDIPDNLYNGKYQDSLNVIGSRK